MNRLFVLVGMLALAVAFSSVQAQDKDKKDDKPLSIKEVMKKSHGKVGTLQAEASAALKEKDFDKLTKITTEWQKNAEALAKAKPKKGSAESWETLTSAYVKAIKTMHEGAEAKDAKKVQGALGFVGSSCGKCHPKHK